MYKIIEPSLEYRQQIEELYEKSLRRNPQGFIQDISFHGNIYDLFENYQRKGGAAKLIKMENKVVGIGGLCFIDKATAELCKVHVDSDYQGLGLGRMILMSLIEEAKNLGFSSVELHVTVTQKPAISLYKSVGFEIFNEERSTVQVNSKEETYDIIFMRKYL